MTSRTKGSIALCPIVAMAEPDAIHFSREAEENCLACALVNAKAARRLIVELEPLDFHSVAHQRVFLEIRRLVAEDREIDPLIVGERLSAGTWFKDKGGVAWLHSLAALPALAANVDEYARIVRELSRRRETDKIAREMLAGNLTAAEAAEALAELGDGAGPSGRSDAFVDWLAFWDRGRDPAEWVFEDVLARGRGHAIYASHKEGKSLLTLYMAAKLATMSEPIVVAYLDYEMGAQDLHERLEDMGYGPEVDLSRLRYALLPCLPPLDTAEGARALCAMLDGVQADFPEYHQVVVIDTIGRALAGEENSADTLRDFHRHTGIQLRRRGCTWARLDHGGKDPTKGQRGTSGKGDDVDIVWRLARTERGVILHRDLARMAWVPERVCFGLKDDPLRYERVDYAYPSGTAELAEELDRLGVPPHESVRATQRALRAAGKGRKQEVIAAALRWRRERMQQLEL